MTQIDKIFTKAPRLMRSMLAATIVAITGMLTACDGMIYDEEGDCDPYYKVRFRYDGWSTGSSDFGDITCVMPGVQFNAAGATGTGHGIDYQTADPDRQCVGSAKAQLLVADALLKEDAAAAKGIVAGYEPKYPSAAAFLAALDAMVLDKDAVVYDGQGNATVDYQNAE